MRTAEKLILVAVAALSSGLAVADGRPEFAGRQWVGPVAQLTQDDRASFRDRWREMSPEQREAVRDRLRQEWRNVPPEQRQQRSQEVLQRMHGQPANSPGPGWHQDQGYGQGYGTRPWAEPNRPGR